MVSVISWKYERATKRFVIKFSDRRRIKVKTTNAILKLDISVQRQILEMGVPMDNNNDHTCKMIRRLKKKFQKIDKPEVVEWNFDQKFRSVLITWSNQDEEEFELSEVINSYDVSFLRRLSKISCSNEKRSLEVVSLENMIKGRLEYLEEDGMDVSDEEEEEDEKDSDEEEGSDGYVSDVIPDSDEWFLG